MTTPGQLRAARALLGLSQQEVANAADVSIPTVKRVERDRVGAINVTRETRNKIQRALEQAGVEFTNGDAPGVRLKHKPRRR